MQRKLVALVAVFAALPAAPAQTEARPDAARRRTPVVQVFERCRDAVVNIATTRVQRARFLESTSLWDEIFGGGVPRTVERRVQSVGSGVIVHPSGYILTNAHVVAQTSDVSVIFADERTLQARIIAVNPEYDLAVLKVESPQPLHTVQLGRSDDILIGETVVAIGNPLGYQHTVTAGIVSALNRELQFSPEVVYRGLIQTDAAINPGNSGGPLLNANAELIGITTAIRGDAQNVGFAIPVDRVWELLPSLLDIERRERVKFGLRLGGHNAEVREVRPDSPAARAGLRPNDRITHFDGAPLTDTVDYYVHLLEHRPGDTVVLRYERDGRTGEAKVELQAIPPPDGTALAARLLGIKPIEFRPETRRRYGLSDEVGVLVDEVIPRSPADRAGIESGDVILRIDGNNVPNLADLGLVLESVLAGERVVVEGLRIRSDPPFIWNVALRTSRAP
ncbi:MAG: trypsin-like peptidase domain-containing protein [Phycisphaerae bacterium]|jgi:serine protease Do